MKLFLTGLWLTVVALGAAFGGASLGAAPPHEAQAEAAAYRTEKTRTVNVPIIVDGVMQGYVGMQFSYVVDPAAAKALTVSPEVYLLDAAFSAVYMDSATDFRHLERVDMPALTRRLVQDTNAHLGAPVIKDVLVQEFNYIPKDVQKD